jgi:D-alanyl-D-alanine carboxypeptidase/D-alanyl-D-alanine-endopeptidase (penicillin-binding protein 4)
MLNVFGTPIAIGAKVFALVFATVAGIAIPALAAPTMKTSCHLLNKEGAKVEGSHLGELFEVASVAKVFTSYWAVTQLGPNFRFETRFHITPIPNSSAVDLHIEGSGDPMFSRFQLYAAIAELNKLKIQNIRHLTYDENFYYLLDPRSDAANEEFWGGARIEPGLPKVGLNTTFANIRRANNETVKAKWKKVFLPAQYGQLVAHLKKFSPAVRMPVNIYMAVASINHLPLASYVRKDSTKTYATLSLPLHRILKEINRSSNNRASEIIFKVLGGKERFAEFMEAQLGLDQDDVSFVNGSGYPDILQVPKVYDKATCEAVIAVIEALDNEMDKSKMGLEDVLSVSAPSPGAFPAGPQDNAGREGSTISGRYGSGAFQHAVVAKTGSVDPVVSLAGVLHTQQGEVYFTHIHGATGRSSWKRVRPKIFIAMQNLLAKFGGAAPIEYTYSVYAHVDEQSAFRELMNSAQVGVKP